MQHQVCMLRRLVGGGGGSNNQMHWNMANAASGVWCRGDDGRDGKGQVSK